MPAKSNASADERRGHADRRREIKAAIPWTRLDRPLSAAICVPSSALICVCF
jgi:hypothetical protein